MASMDVPIQLIIGDQNAEIVLSVDYEVTSEGCPAHYGSLSYPGHPAEPMEMEIEHIFWPIKRWDKDNREFVDDHADFPPAGLPDAINKAVEIYICEHHEPEPYYEE